MADFRGGAVRLSVLAVVIASYGEARRCIGSVRLIELGVVELGKVAAFFRRWRRGLLASGVLVLLVHDVAEVVEEGDGDRSRRAAEAMRVSHLDSHRRGHLRCCLLVCMAARATHRMEGHHPFVLDGLGLRLVHVLQREPE